jgi:hypothetical protein
VKIERVTSKSFEYDAVLVTEKNLDEVAKWVRGDVVFSQGLEWEDFGSLQCAAAVGEWIVKHGEIGCFETYNAENFDYRYKVVHEFSGKPTQDEIFAEIKKIVKGATEYPLEEALMTVSAWSHSRPYRSETAAREILDLFNRLL